MTLFDYEATDAHGRAHPLAAYRGHPLLIVNVASGCGFTPQMRGLEALHQRFASRGLVILAFPSDDFHQERLRDEDLLTCPAYRVSFPVLGLTHVRGPDCHPIFTALTKLNGGFLGAGVRWNFEKFLVDARGEPVARWRSITSPTAGRITRAIEDVLTPGPGHAT